jgi:hypothetical protein
MGLASSRRGQFFIVSCVLIIMSLHMISLYITQRHVPMGDISIGQLNALDNLLSAVENVDRASDDFARERNMRALDILLQASLKTEAVDWEGQVRYISDWSLAERYLFSLDAGLRSYLKEGRLSNTLSAALAANGVKLPPSATMRQAGPKVWRIDADGRAYSVEDASSELKVCELNDYRYPVHLTSTYDVEDAPVSVRLELPTNSSRSVVVKEKGSESALSASTAAEYHLSKLYMNVNWTAPGTTSAFRTRTFYVYIDVAD